MPRLLAILTAAVVINLLAGNQARAESFYEESQLTTSGTLELTYQTVHLADWLQTLTIARNPERFYETNKVLGEHPSVSDVNRYFLSTAIGHALISHILPPTAARVWQGATITMQLGYVQQNHQLGIGFNVRY